MKAYTKEDHYAAAVAYYMEGTYQGASRLCNVPAETIRAWTKQEWWIDIADQVVADISAKIRAKGNRIVELATSAVIDRLENGDEVVDKHGNFLRKKVQLKDALLASLTWFDKNRIINEKGSGVNVRANAKEMMEQMAAIAAKNKEDVLNKIPDFEVNDGTPREPGVSTGPESPARTP